jgi:hypothetical protein
MSFGRVQIKLLIVVAAVIVIKLSVFFFFLFMMKKIKTFVVELGKYQLKSAIFYYSQIIDSIFTYVLILEIKINLRGFFFER